MLAVHVSKYPQGDCVCDTPPCCPHPVFSLHPPVSSHILILSIIRLLVDLLDDALSELTYAATLAGLSYDVTHEKAGVYLSISGYSDKLPLLLRAVVDKLVEFEIKEDRVAVYKEQVRSLNL